MPEKELGLAEQRRILVRIIQLTAVRHLLMPIAMRAVFFAATGFVLVAAADPVTITVHRTVQSKDCVTGQILINGEIVGYTLERPVLDNIPLISAIPPKTYTARVRSDSDKWRIELDDVPRRYFVQIHNGSVPANTLGCILVGRSLAGACQLNDPKTAFDGFKLQFAQAAKGEADEKVKVTIIINGP